MLSGSERRKGEELEKAEGRAGRKGKAGRKKGHRSRSSEERGGTVFLERGAQEREGTLGGRGEYLKGGSWVLKRAWPMGEGRYDEKET